MLTVRPERLISHEPEIATLWVDEAGMIAYLHHAPDDGYQLTRLRDGIVLRTGKNKSRLVAGFCGMPCEVTIQNSYRADYLARKTET